MAHVNSGSNTQKESDLVMASHYINPQSIWNLFYEIYDGNEYACAGAMGNMQVESGLYSDQAENLWNNLTGKSDEWLTENINNGTIDLAEFLKRDWWVNAYGFGYGLSQWTTSARRTKLWDFTMNQGLPIDSEVGQFNYIKWEWLNSESSYHRLLDYMQRVDNILDATIYYCNNYEVGSWTDARYTNAVNWYNTFATGGTGRYGISLTTSGNGTATVNPRRANAGDTITLTANPASGETLIDIIARLVSTGEYMAIAVITGSQTFPMPSDDLSIYVEFSGEPPTPPTPIGTTKKHRMPIWMYPSLRRRI